MADVELKKAMRRFSPEEQVEVQALVDAVNGESADGVEERVTALEETVDTPETGLVDRVEALEEGGGAIGMPFLPELQTIEEVVSSDETDYRLYQMVAAKKHISVPTYDTYNVVLLPDPETLAAGDTFRVFASETPGDKPLLLGPYGTVVDENISKVPTLVVNVGTATMLVVTQEGGVVSISEFSNAAANNSDLYLSMESLGTDEDEPEDTGSLWARVLDLQDTVNDTDTGLVDRVKALEGIPDTATITLDTVIDTDAVVVNGTTLTFGAGVVKGASDITAATALAAAIDALPGLSATSDGAVVTVTADPTLMVAATTEATTITVAYTANAYSVFTAIRVLGD